MYWGNRKSSPHALVRANLDGSSAKIFSTGFEDIQYITLGRISNDDLYWPDNGDHTIGTVGVDCGNKRTLVKLEGNPGPEGIQVDDQKIYFGNWSGENIQSVDRDSGANLTTIFKSTTGGVGDLALCYTPLKQS